MIGVKEGQSKIYYSIEFLTQLNALLPDNEEKKEILKLANNNELYLGQKLNDLTDQKITPEEVVDAFEKDGILMHNLYVKAKELAKYDQIWSLYMEEIEKHAT